MLNLIVAFISGVVFGWFSFILISIYLVNKEIKRNEAKVKKLTDLISQTKSLMIAREKLKKVREISVKQMELKGQIEMPQKNSLDGKYKNQLSEEIRVLEEEKINILNSILKDNIDPEILVLDEFGNTKTMKLSEYMNKMGYSIKDNKNHEKPKFTVYNGGKNIAYIVDDNDDDNETNGKTFH
jgi:hypothetical protein